MKRNVLPLLMLPLLSAVLLFAAFQNYQAKKVTASVAYEPQEYDKTAFDKLRNQYMFDMVKDPVTGKIPEGIIKKSYMQARMAPTRESRSPENNNTYLSAGALNAGGRTRALAYDKRYNGGTNQVMIAGAVSGGIFRSADGGATWTRTSTPGEIHNVHWIVQDTSTGAGANLDRWYACGGEHWGNSASENGAAFGGEGIYRSTDNGQTWTKLTLTYPGGPAAPLLERFDHAFDFVMKMAINPTNGHLYVGAHRRLMRSTDFGASWEVVHVGTQASTAVAGTMDVVVTNTGRVICAQNGACPDIAFRGVFSSTTGASGSFTRIAGGPNGAADSIPGWRGNSYSIINATPPIFYEPKRIVLALAPSNNNIMYVAYENGEAAGPDADLWRVDLSTNTWTNRSANVPNLGGSVGTFSTQGGYDLTISIKPNDPNFVVLGGVNLHRSTDGFATTVNTTWIGGYGNPNATPFLYPNHHPDQHVNAFRPDNPNEMISGHDGGISKTTDINATTVAWSQVPNYQTFQYYYVAIDPTAGRNNFMGGLQDNGTWLRDRAGILGTAANDSNNHRFLFPAFSGDGGSVGMATNSGANQVVYGSSQFGTLRRATLPTISGSTLIRPDGLTSGGTGFGEFVTIFKLNPTNTEDLYYVNFNRLFRTTSASTATSSSGWTEFNVLGFQVDPSGNPNSGRYIRSLAMSWGPYLPTHALYIGTTDGRIFRIDDPRNAAGGAVPVNISIPGLPVPGAGQAGVNIQDIAVNPNNDNEVIAVISNYEVNNANIASVWWTNNAKSATPTWRNAEGSLITAASARSCAIVVKKDASNNPVTEYYIGTSVGLFSAVNIGPTLIGGGSVNWFREGSGVMNLPIVQSLAYRPSDNVLLVGTHGNGMYFTYLGTPNYNPNGATGINNPILNDRNFISRVLPTVTSSTVQYQVGTLTRTKRIIINMYNSNGQEVFRSSTGYQNGAVGMTKFARGTYILSITSDDGRYKHVQKVMKQ